MITYAIRFAVGFVLARFLGSEQLGLHKLALTVAAFVGGATSLGLDSALIRHIPHFANQRDEAGLWGVLQVGLGLPLAVSLLGGLGLFFLAEPIAAQLLHEPSLVPLLRMLSFAIPFMTLTTVAAAATRGFNRMEYTAFVKRIAMQLIRLILVLVLGLTVGLTATTAVAAYAVAAIATGVLLLFFLNRLFSVRRSLQAGQRPWRGMLGFALPVYGSQVLKTFGPSLRTMLLGALDTISSVGVFAVAGQVNSVGQMFHTSIVVTSAPVVAELHQRQEWELLKRFYQTMTKWTFTLNLPLFLIILLFPASILSVFGEDYTAGAVALSILAWANLVNTGTGICGVLVDMTGNTPLRLLNSIVAFVLTLGLNVLLIPLWGLVGLAVASLASAAVVNLLGLVEVYVLFRMLPYDVSFLKPIAAGLVALGVGLGFKHLLPIEAELVRLAVAATLLFAAYVAMILLLRLSQEDRAVLAHIVRRLSPARAKRRSKGDGIP